MLYFRIKEDSKAAKAFVQYIKTLSFVEIIESDIDNPILKDIKEGLQQVKETREGKRNGKTLTELLDDE